MTRKPWHQMNNLILAAILILASVLSVLVPSAVRADGTSYYVDSAGGSDSNTGSSETQAWKTLDKVNTTVFQPGDRILFKAGGVWTGTLSPQGSGSEGSPIQIDRYSEGAKPLIAGGGAAAAVYFYNQEQWEVRNLEITNNAASPGERRGIHVSGSSGSWTNPKVYKHFVFENLDIHQVKGTTATDYVHNGGIIVWGPDWDLHVSDVVIKNNRIYSLDSVGIYLNGAQRTYSTGLKLQNNVINDVAADGAVVLNTTGGLIEHNVVYDTHVRASGYHVPLWVWGTKDAVIQYNEVYNTAPGGDAMAYDADYNSDGTIIQYNYSHHNAGGMVLVVNDGTAASNYNTNAVVRYNISENDGGAVFNLNGPVSGAKFYNNTVYLPLTSSTKVVNYGFWDGYASNTAFYNNLIYNLGTGGYLFGSSTGNIFDNNLFYGNHPSSEPADPHKITADPKLASPGSGGIGRGTLAGYQLLNTSPAIGSGRIISGNGGSDYFGNPVPAGTAPNIGAYQGAGLDPNNLPPLPQPPSQNNLLLNPGFETGDFSNWPLHYNGASIVNTGAHNGAYAAALTGNYAGMEQNIGGLHPNTMYKLYAYGAASGGGSAVFGVKNHGNAEQSVYMTAAAYTRKEITFTTGASSTSATIFLYKAGGAGQVTFDDLELIQFSASPAGPAEPVFTEGGSDEFAGPDLDGQWTWVRENSAAWSLTANPGSMRITAENGEIAEGSATAKNLLLTGAPEGDWTLETKLTGLPASPWAQGGLIVYESDATFVRITRMYGTGNEFQFTAQKDTVRQHVETADTLGSAVYLRLVKTGNTYSGFYSADGVSYQQAGADQTVEIAEPKIGLFTGGGTGFTANYDYFRFIPVETEPEPEPVNLLQNPGFESGDFTGWSVHYNGASISDTAPHTGDYAALLSGSASGIEQTVSGLLPDTTYRLSGLGQSADGGVAVFGVKNYGGTFTDAWGFEQGTGYVHKEIEFTTGSANTSAKIYLYKGSAAGEVHFDDLVLSAVQQ